MLDAADGIRDMLTCVFREHARDWNSAMRDPHNPDCQRRAMFPVQFALAELRAIRSGTSLASRLLGEASDLMEMARTLRIGGDESAFIKRMYREWVIRRQTWGDKLTHQLCLDGALTLLLPTIVRRLSADGQQRAFTYASSVIHHYLTPAVRRKVPSDLRDRLDEALRPCANSQPLLHGLRDLGLVMGDVEEYERVGRLICRERDDPYLARRPEHLIFFARTGLLLAYMRGIMQRIAGPDASSLY